MSKLIDLTGQRFGRLTVIKRTENNKRRKVQWLCQCECGTIKKVSGVCLRRGETISCGCYQRERAVECQTTHGLRYTRLYNIWSHINTRCYNENYKQYKDYGGRGIKNEFKEFKSFAAWAKKAEYKNDLTIDRINNNGNYSKDNCRWITRAEQNRNKRTNVFITHPRTGEKLCITDWSKKIGGSAPLIYDRIKRGWTIEKAITTLVGEAP